MSYIEYYNKYIDIINKYKNCEIKLKSSKVFEYLVAIELKMVMWDNIAHKIGKVVPLTTFGDCGVDMVSFDLRKCAQVKSGKYKKGLAYKDLCTFLMYSTLGLDIHNNILVVEDNMVINFNGLHLFNKVLRFNRAKMLESVPNKSVSILVNPYIPYDRLECEQKIIEFIEYVKSNGKPNGKIMFSDGTNMYRFMNDYRRLRKFNYTIYNDIYDLSVMKKYYGKIYSAPIDEKTQYNELVDYHDKYGKKVFDLNIWKVCKQEKMLHRSAEFASLANIPDFELDYEQHIKDHFPDDYKLVKTINNIIRLLDTWDGDDKSSMLDIGIWKQCMKDKLYNFWPYTKLAEIEPFSSQLE